MVIPTITSTIIPQNHANTQDELSKTSNQIDGEGGFSFSTHWSEIQKEAEELYNLGLNVFPQPIGKKAGLPWKNLQFTRICHKHHSYGLDIVFTGNCNIAVMCGRTSGNLFVIDCETEEALRHHINQLKEKQIPLWAAETGRGGHIYLRCADGEVKNIDSGVLKDSEIKGQSRYVIAPPSLHPSGKQYKWIARESDSIPTVHAEQIDWLQTKSGQSISLVTTKQKTKPGHIDNRLSQSTKRYLEEGCTTPIGERNNTLFRAACDLAGNNYNREETEALLIPIAEASGLPRGEIRQTIYSAHSRYRKAAKPVLRNQPKNLEWKYAENFALNRTWQGRNSSSQKTLFLAFVERAKVDSDANGCFRASIRELAILGKMGTATVQRTLNSLTDPKNPLIIRVGHHKESRAGLWKFAAGVIDVGKQLNLDTLQGHPPWKGDNVSILDSSDVAERGALGQMGLYFYRLMCSLPAPMMPKQLVEHVNLKLHQVKYLLKKLERFALVERVENGWSAVKVAASEFDQIAVDAGTVGKGRKRRDCYARERAVFASRALYFARLNYEGRVYSQAVETYRTSVLQELDIPTECKQNSLIALCYELGGSLVLDEAEF